MGDKSKILPQLKDLVANSEPVVEMPAVDIVVLEGCLGKPNKDKQE